MSSEKHLIKILQRELKNLYFEEFMLTTEKTKRHLTAKETIEYIEIKSKIKSIENCLSLYNKN